MIIPRATTRTCGKTNVHILDGNAQDLQKECDDFEQSIKDAGGVDLFVGGWRD